MQIGLKSGNRFIDIVQTRKCHANAAANADTNGIRTKNNMPPFPFCGGHN